MDKKVNRLKINMWKKQLKALEEVNLPNALKGMRQTAPVGNWHENNEYEQAQADIELIRARIIEVKKLIQKLGG